MKNSREENEFIRHYLHSKQGISFVTLTHKTVMKKMSQSFFFVVASKTGNFANQFLDAVLQCCPTILGRFSQLDAHFPCRFLEFGRGGGSFFEKKQNKSCCFQNVFNFLAANFLLAAGIFCFSRQFSFCFQVFHFNRKKEHLVGKPSFLNRKRRQLVQLAVFFHLAPIRPLMLLSANCPPLSAR